MSSLPSCFGVVLRPKRIHMVHDTYYPTPEEIRRVKYLMPGWEYVWNKIATELCGYGGEGRLAQAVKFLHLKPQEAEDFVSFALCEFQKEISERKLLDDYDPDHPKANVYKYIFGKKKKRLSQYYGKFRKETLFFKGNLIRSEHKDKEGTPIPLEDSLMSIYREMSDIIRNNLKSLCARLCDEKLTLQLSENSKFDRIHEHAGLQLYPRLNDAITTIQQLIDYVYGAVRKANAMYTEPARTIAREHQEAEDRIQRTVEKYSDELFCLTKDKLKNTEPEKREKIKDKLLETDVERYFYPLATEQMMRLLNLQKNNVEQIHSRYKKRLPKLLPFSEEDREMMRELGILNEEGDEDD